MVETIVGLVFGSYLVAGAFLAGGKWDIYSRPVKQPSPFIRAVYFVLGLVMLGIGILGIVGP